MGGMMPGVAGFCSPGQPGGISQLWAHWFGGREDRPWQGEGDFDPPGKGQGTEDLACVRHP